MAGPGGSEGLRAEVAWTRIAEKAEERAARYERLTEQTETISVTETVGLASVTVDVSGAVTGLTLADNIRSKRGGQVATDVLAAMRRAQAGLAERMAAVAAATVGPEDRVGAGLTRRLRERFGEPAPPPARQPMPAERGEDFADEPILRRYR
jgi:hypothetical protein